MAAGWGIWRQDIILQPSLTSHVTFEGRSLKGPLTKANQYYFPLSYLVLNKAPKSSGTLISNCSTQKTNLLTNAWDGIGRVRCEGGCTVRHFSITLAVRRPDFLVWNYWVRSPPREGLAWLFRLGLSCFNWLQKEPPCTKSFIVLGEMLWGFSLLLVWGLSPTIFSSREQGASCFLT